MENVDSNIISEFDNFVIRLGNHKSTDEEIKYKNRRINMKLRIDKY